MYIFFQIINILVPFLDKSFNKSLAKTRTAELYAILFSLTVYLKKIETESAEIDDEHMIIRNIVARNNRSHRIAYSQTLNRTIHLFVSKSLIRIYESSFSPNTHVKTTANQTELFEVSYSVAWESNIRFRDYTNIFTGRTLFIYFFIETLQNAILFSIMLSYGLDCCHWMYSIKHRIIVFKNLLRKEQYFKRTILEILCREKYRRQSLKLHFSSECNYYSLKKNNNFLSL